MDLSTLGFSETEMVDILCVETNDSATKSPLPPTQLFREGPDNANSLCLCGSLHICSWSLTQQRT